MRTLSHNERCTVRLMDVAESLVARLGMYPSQSIAAAAKELRAESNKLTGADAAMLEHILAAFDRALEDLES